MGVPEAGDPTLGVWEQQERVDLGQEVAAWPGAPGAVAGRCRDGKQEEAHAGAVPAVGAAPRVAQAGPLQERPCAPGAVRGPRCLTVPSLVLQTVPRG